MLSIRRKPREEWGSILTTKIRFLLLRFNKRVTSSPSTYHKMEASCSWLRKLSSHASTRSEIKGNWAPSLSRLFRSRSRQQSRSSSRLVQYRGILGFGGVFVASIFAQTLSLTSTGFNAMVDSLWSGFVEVSEWLKGRTVTGVVRFGKFCRILRKYREILRKLREITCILHAKSQSTIP